ncbi:hypothetical protein IscW_ISCW015910 [Ixodes scapularis]|uniref:Uncharacterized protein n=1 Tax=Ixodes scapularis TaxID=6945 RepID=B7P1D2_IXOSC|nr:hypothetical protein IscW_ISCW015910 [Ixodes scapularis]|eukprot:XP_002433340.1 hypothetical protein IscW_ISCW015910 [Ixodes scapularis]
MREREKETPSEVVHFASHGNVFAFKVQNNCRHLSSTVRVPSSSCSVIYEGSGERKRAEHSACTPRCQTGACRRSSGKSACSHDMIAGEKERRQTEMSVWERGDCRQAERRNCVVKSETAEKKVVVCNHQTVATRP